MVIIRFHIQISKRKEENKGATEQNEGKKVKESMLRNLKVMPKAWFYLLFARDFFCY